jgi:hypothetical protein
MVPPAQAPYLGMPPIGFGMPQLGVPPLGLGMPQFGVPPVPAPFLGIPPLGILPTSAPYLGVPPMGVHPATAPYLGVPPMGLGMPQLGVPPMGFPFPPVPAPYLGVPPLGFDMQMTPWPIAGLGGHHVVSPVTAMLLHQLGLREAVSHIADAALKQRVTDNVNEAIDRTIESVSGMTLHPWFGPGAQSMIYPIAAQLALIADRYPDGALKDALITIAGQIVQKSLAPTGESTGRHR